MVAQEDGQDKKGKDDKLHQLAKLSWVEDIEILDFLTDGNIDWTPARGDNEKLNGLALLVTYPPRVKSITMQNPSIMDPPPPPLHCSNLCTNYTILQYFI